MGVKGSKMTQIYPYCIISNMHPTKHHNVWCKEVNSFSIERILIFLEMLILPPDIDMKD